MLRMQSPASSNGNGTKASRSAPITPARSRAHSQVNQGHRSTMSSGADRRLRSPSFVFGSPVRHGQQYNQRQTSSSTESAMSNQGGNPYYTSPHSAGTMIGINVQNMDAKSNSSGDSSMTSQSGTNRYQMGPRRDSVRGAAVVPAPGLLHPQFNGQQTMTGINEKLAVEEFGYRRGQFDRGRTSSRHPPNPFSSSLDAVWNEHYMRGRSSKADPAVVPSTLNSPSVPNYEWAPLINPMTQTPEYPNGAFHEPWVKAQLMAALNSMSSLITDVIYGSRHREGRRHNDNPRGLVCDIPLPMVAALNDFPELREWYHQMLEDAADAKSGGRPPGYQRDEPSRY